MLLGALCWLSTGMAAQAAGDGARYDFTNGIPADFTLIDADGNTPSADIAPYGFSVGTPWVDYYVESEQNHVAASTSWYAQSGTSDDWMILPAVSVETADAVVAWRARATDANFSDGYAVYISEGGDAIEDFDKAHPLFTTAAESAEWTYHSISLDGYVGKTVRIAFVNNSTDCSLLYIDDVFVGTPQPARVISGMRPIVKPTDEIIVQGTVTTDMAEPVKGFTVGYEWDGKTGQVEFNDTELVPGESVPFSISTGSYIEEGGSATFTIWAEAGGRRSQTEATVTSRVNKVVAEELTGSWCGWCVRGIVALDETKKAHPEQFIAIAVHGNDFLESPEYTDYIAGLIGSSGYPNSVVNRDRNTAGDPEYIPVRFEQKASAPIEGYVTLETGGEDGLYEATAKVALNSNGLDGRYRMAYAIVENDVYEEGNSNYVQHNSYAGGANGEMGGYEDLPEYVPDFHFQDVARGTIGDPSGIEGSLPLRMDAGREYVTTESFTLPETVLNVDNVYIVAMLIDTRSSGIVNADMAKLTADDPAGIAGPGVNTEPERVEIYTVDGRRVAEGSLVPGIYIRRTVSGGKATTEKFMAR